MISPEGRLTRKDFEGPKGGALDEAFFHTDYGLPPEAKIKPKRRERKQDEVPVSPLLTVVDRVRKRQRSGTVYAY